MDRFEVVLSKKARHRRISLRRELVDEVEKFVENDPRYTSIADFVTESVRIRLQDLGFVSPILEANLEAITSG